MGATGQPNLRLCRWVIDQNTCRRVVLQLRGFVGPCVGMKAQASAITRHRAQYHNAQLWRAVRINGADGRCVCGAVPVRYTGCNHIPRFGKTRVKVVIIGWQGDLIGHWTSN